MIQRRTPLKRTGRPKPMSDKRRLQADIYRTRRLQFLAEHPTCQACTVESIPSTEVHHKKGRTGKNYLDTSTWIAVCRGCHEWIHSHPSQARLLGLLGF